MLVYAAKWTLDNSIKCCKAQWLIRGVSKIPAVHFDPMAAHALVALVPSLLILISLTMKHSLEQLDVKLAFPNPLLLRESGCVFLPVVVTNLDIPSTSWTVLFTAFAKLQGTVTLHNTPDWWR